MPLNLYVNSNGWASVEKDNEYTKHDAEKRTWKLDCRGRLRLPSGAQLFGHPEADWCAQVAMEGDGANTDSPRRKWSWDSASGLISLQDGRQLYVDMDNNVRVGCPPDSGRSGPWLGVSAQFGSIQLGEQVEVGFTLSAKVKSYSSNATYTCFVVSKNESDGSFSVGFRDESLGLQVMNHTDSFRILAKETPDGELEEWQRKLMTGLEERLGQHTEQERIRQEKAEEEAKIQREKDQATEQKQRTVLQELQAGIYSAAAFYTVQTDSDNYGNENPDYTVECKYRLEVNNDFSIKFTKKEEGRTVSFSGSLEMKGSLIGVVWKGDPEGYEEERNALTLSVVDANHLYITDTYNRYESSDRKDSLKDVKDLPLLRQVGDKDTYPCAKAAGYKRQHPV